MRIPLTSGRLLLTATLAASAVVSRLVTAQGPGRSSDSTTASTMPRTADGRPDLNGTWVPPGPGRGAQLKLPDGSICVTNCADLLPGGAAAGRDGAAPPG